MMGSKWFAIRSFTGSKKEGLKELELLKRNPIYRYRGGAFMSRLGPSIYEHRLRSDRGMGWTILARRRN